MFANYLQPPIVAKSLLCKALVKLSLSYILAFYQEGSQVNPDWSVHYYLVCIIKTCKLYILFNLICWIKISCFLPFVFLTKALPWLGLGDKDGIRVAKGGYLPGLNLRDEIPALWVSYLPFFSFLIFSSFESKLKLNTEVNILNFSSLNKI